MVKELTDISWNISESEYRKDSALSYSTLATYERGGFYSLKTLFDKKESPSLLLGSIVDCLITDGEESFNNTYAVLDYNITDSGINICKALASMYKNHYKEFKNIPDVLVSQAAQEIGFWKDPKWNNRRYKEILNTGDVETYYNSLVNSDKIIISSQLYTEALAMVEALKNSPATKFYFEANNPFDESIKRYYQLKFKATLSGIDYRCMADLIVVNYKEKTIQMVDLKTSSHYESEFYKSFIDWSYFIQAKLYYRIVFDNISKDDYFKDFTMLPYLFIVVNKNTLTPLIWKFEDTFKKGNCTYGKNNTIEFRDPEIIGKELTFYLNNECKVPLDINIDKPNNIINYINKYM